MYRDDDKLIQIVDGLLLGDASIEDGSCGARLSLKQSLSHSEWVDQVKTQLHFRGVVCDYIESKGKGETTIKGKTYNQQSTYGIRTVTYVFFKEQRNRW